MEFNDAQRQDAAEIAAEIVRATAGEVSGSAAETFARLTVHDFNNAQMMIGGALSTAVLPALPADAGIDRLILSLIDEGARFGAQFAASLFGDHADATITWSAAPADMLAQAQLQTGRPVACLVPQHVAIDEFFTVLCELAELPMASPGTVILLASDHKLPLEAFNYVPDAVRARVLELPLGFTPEPVVDRAALRDNSAIGRRVRALANVVSAPALGALWHWRQRQIRKYDGRGFSSYVPGKIAVLEASLHLAELTLGVKLAPDMEESIWMHEYRVEDQVERYAHEVLSDYIASNPDQFPETGEHGCTNVVGMHLPKGRVCVRADLFPAIMADFGFPVIEGYLGAWATSGKLDIKTPPHHTRRTLPDGVTHPVYIVVFPGGVKRLPEDDDAHVHATGDGS